MNRNPYRPEIVGTFCIAPVVLGIETWRRWGELASPAALDDWLVFLAAMGVATQLARRRTSAPFLWVFVCGGAWFLFCLSLWGSIYSWDGGDPSGAPMPVVLAFKGVGVTLTSWASVRAIRRVSGRASSEKNLYH